MHSYMIGYDLKRPGQDYTELITAIKALGNWWHCLDSTWVVKSDASAQQIREYLQTYLDANDKLLVVLLVRNASWTAGFDKGCSDWLQNNL